jgi:hypothetical protein
MPGIGNDFGKGFLKLGKMHCLRWPWSAGDSAAAWAPQQKQQP